MIKCAVDRGKKTNAETQGAFRNLNFDSQAEAPGTSHFPQNVLTQQILGKLLTCFFSFFTFFAFLLKYWGFRPREVFQRLPRGRAVIFPCLRARILPWRPEIHQTILKIDDFK